MYRVLYLFLLACYGAVALQACVTARSRQTADGREIPNRELFEVRSYEHRCEPFSGANIKQLQEILNQFGRSGWELASTVVQNGNMVGFCLKK